MSGGATGAVLYVSYDGLLEPLGASQVVPYVLGARRAGVDIGVLSFEKPSDLADRGAVEALERRLEAAGVSWTVRRFHARPTLPATGLDVLAGRRAVSRWVDSRSGPRVVHARSYVAGLMAAAADAQILFDMRGFWVDERIAGGYWKPGSLPVRIGRALERRVLEAADHLILLTRKGVERVGDLSSEAASLPATVIPTCVDTDRFRPPDDPAEARREFGLGPGPVLIHAGTLSGWYDGAATMAVGRRWQERTGGRFVVLTRDVRHARTLAVEASVEPLIRTVPSHAVPSWLRAADAGLALVRPSPAKDASYPTRIGEYLATGLAVLTTPVGDLEALADGRVVSVMEDGDLEGAVAWLEEAAVRPDRVARARELAREELSLDEGVRRLVRVYRRLGVSGGREA